MSTFLSIPLLSDAFDATDQPNEKLRKCSENKHEPLSRFAKLCKVRRPAEFFETFWRLNIVLRLSG